MTLGLACRRLACEFAQRTFHGNWTGWAWPKYPPVQDRSWWLNWIMKYRAWNVVYGQIDQINWSSAPIIYIDMSKWVRLEGSEVLRSFATKSSIQSILLTTQDALLQSRGEVRFTGSCRGLRPRFRPNVKLPVVIVHGYSQQWFLVGTFSRAYLSG